MALSWICSEVAEQAQVLHVWCLSFHPVSVLLLMRKRGCSELGFPKDTPWKMRAGTHNQAYLFLSPKLIVESSAAYVHRDPVSYMLVQKAAG